MQQRQWDREQDAKKYEREREESIRDREREREDRESLRTHMFETYTRFLTGAAALGLASASEHADEKARTVDAVLAEFTLAYHKLLLVASSEAANAATKVWNAAILLTELPVQDEGIREGRAALRAARTEFIREAREDLTEPITRSSNPGFSIKPALTIGGFHLDDAGA